MTVDPVAFVVATLPPGVLVLATGVALEVRSVRRPAGRRSVWGGRLFYFGFALMALVPGLGMAVGVVAGWLQVLALFGSAFAVLYGGGVLYGLRLNWDNPWRGP
jgi:hypothetical protein